MHTNIELSPKKKQFYELFVVKSCTSLNMHVLQSLSKFEILIIKVHICFLYIWSKMSSSLYTMLKLSKTTSPQ